MIDKLLLLYLCVSIAVAFWQPQLIFDDGNSTINMVFNDLGYNTTTNEPNKLSCVGNNCLSSNINQNVQNQTALESIWSQMKGGTSYFIDALNNVIGMFKIIFNVLASPIALFSNPSSPLHDAPAAVAYFFALPLALLLFIAFLNWIRSGIT